MVSNNESLNELRQQVAKQVTNAGRKISRIRKTTGAVVEGTKFDPRNNKDVTKMRRRDLEAYSRRLTNFTSRKTQFLPGARNAPLPVAKWADYEASQAALAAKRAADIAPFKDERLPGPGRDGSGLSDETIGQRQEKIRSKHPTTLNQIYTPPKLEPFNVKDADSLTKLTKSNKKRMTKKFEREEHKRAQTELKKMMEVFNNDALTNRAMSLTYGQFDMLWNLTRFADAMSLGYHQIKAKYDAKESVPESVLQDQISEANTLLDWVEKFKI